jgi:hypothetical protein
MEVMEETVVMEEVSQVVTEVQAEQLARVATVGLRLAAESSG